MAAQYANDLTVDDIIDALATVISPFTGGATMIRGQVNRVSLPTPPVVVLQEMRAKNLVVPSIEYEQITNADTLTIHNRQQFDVQIDFYASNAGDLCSAVVSALRSPWAYNQFPTGIKPLYTADGIQAPLITGEQQYENRWVLMTTLQYNPSLTAPQQYASAATVKTYLADKTGV